MPEHPATAPELFKIANSAGPLVLTEVRIDGVSGNSAEPGASVGLITRLAITSDEVMFQKVVRSLEGCLEHSAQQTGVALSLNQRNFVVVVIREGYTADVWLDTAAVCVRALTKRSLLAGQAVLRNDIADVVGMDMPAIDIGPADKVICLFRCDWRFGLFADFNPDCDFKRDDMVRMLGGLYRNLRYRQAYEWLENTPVFEALSERGWFPFAEIFGDEFDRLANTCAAGFNLEQAEEEICNSFDEKRTAHLLERWASRPHFSGKEDLLRQAISAYDSNLPAAAIKIVLTEIEGILNEAYHAVHGSRTRKMKDLLDFAIQSATRKLGSGDTLLFPEAFAQYLADHTFRNFDLSGPPGDARSRHAVGHGAAKTDSYTRARALQSLLTLDQLSFYT